MRSVVIRPNVRCAPFFTDTLICVDELWQLTRFDIRFKDIREIHPYKSDGTFAFSLPFVKRGGLFIWDLEVVTSSGLATLVAGPATNASEAAAKAQAPPAWPPEQPTAARQPPPQLPPAALRAPLPSPPPHASAVLGPAR